MHLAKKIVCNDCLQVDQIEKNFLYILMEHQQKKRKKKTRTITLQESRQKQSAKTHSTKTNHVYEAFESNLEKYNEC